MRLIGPVHCVLKLLREIEGEEAHERGDQLRSPRPR